MKCESQLCIYFKDNTCILDTIEIDSIGMCNSCTFVNIPEEYLVQEREAALNRFIENDSI